MDVKQQNEVNGSFEDLVEVRKRLVGLLEVGKPEERQAITHAWLSVIRAIVYLEPVVKGI